MLAVLVARHTTRTLMAQPNRVDLAAIELHTYLATLPKDALVAGNAPEIDAVPLFAHRRILWGAEQALPYYTGYHREMERRKRAIDRAFREAARPQRAHFCRSFGVTHLVAEKGATAPEVLESLRGDRVFENRRFLVSDCPRGAA